jgi:hypothetical protein
MLIRGDVKRDGVWAELRVGQLDGNVWAPPRILARLFTHARGGGYVRHVGSETLSWPKRNAPRWIDEEHLALIWEDERSLRQVMLVNASTGEMRALTHHVSDVMHFSLSKQGTLIYGAQVPCIARPTPAEQMEGYVVEARDAFALLYGCGAWERDAQALYVIGVGDDDARRIEFDGGDRESRSAPLFPKVIFSSDGTHALFANSVSYVPNIWSRYTAPHFRDMLASRASDGAAGPYATQFQQLFVIDVATARARVLWDVPNEPYARLRAAWSPAGDSVVVGPSFSPACSAEAAGLAGEAVGIVNVDTGGFERLPVSAEAARGIRQLRWQTPNAIELEVAEGCMRVVNAEGAWHAAPQVCASAGAPSPFEVRLSQGLNKPPTFTGIDHRTGKQALVFDPNPTLVDFALGRVEWIDRQIGAVRWQGRLYYPASYEAGRRYPLVVQTHLSAGADEYSLTGRGGSSPGLGPGTSAYVAQPLASAGFFVLQGNAQVPTDQPLLAQTRLRIDATESLLRALIAEGRVQADRVGIMGYSASGWDVSYALTHPTFAYAAALTDDNKDGTYLQAAVSNWVFGVGEEMIGAPAFGTGLQQWLAQSPSFNIEQVQTPWLMTITAPGSELGRWELFSRLRALRKPVEWYVIPDLTHGSHGLQNPMQLLALQQRALDWWKFWLKDEVDESPAKRSQYERWRALRDERDQLRARGSVSGG